MGKRIGIIWVRIGLLALVLVSFCAMVVSGAGSAVSNTGGAGFAVSAQVQQSKRMGQAGQVKGVQENDVRQGGESEQDEVSVLGLGDITAGYVSEDNSGYPMYGTPNS
ncbi:MAG: hypothetical protein FWD76_05970, partial [Firmicutes bacterium]|nr:hypothetical protein [Bacillota bacterium]